MPEEDESATEVNKSQEIFGVIFPAHDQAPEVVEPGKHPFDFPAAAKATQAATILSPSLGSASLPMRRDHFRRELFHHFPIKFVTVVGFVSNQALGDIRDKARLHGLAHQLYFSRRSTGCA